MIHDHNGNLTTNQSGYSLTYDAWNRPVLVQDGTTTELEGVQAEFAMMGRACRPASAGVELVGEMERYEDIYRLCYVRGPEVIIVELAEEIG